LLSKTDWASPAEHAKAKSECHLRSAKRLLKLCKENGGVFIKLGQHLSALVYLLPVEYCNTLKELQDQCPPSSIESLNDLFLSDANQSLESLFSSFDPNPVGVASLAQVHRAVLRETGQEVAVKIQHPALDDYTAVDVKTVTASVKWVKRMFPDFEFDWLADEMQNSLPKETDFTHEAENANKVRELFSSKKVLKIPRIYRAQRRILIMECTVFYDCQFESRLIITKQSCMERDWTISITSTLTISPRKRSPLSLLKSFQK
jgi:aarF domain-containing kinase